MRSDAADFMHLRADLSRCIASKSGAINYLIILRAKAAHCQGAAACNSSSLSILQGSLFYALTRCGGGARYNLCSSAAGRSLAARTFALRTAALCNYVRLMSLFQRLRWRAAQSDVGVWDIHTWMQTASQVALRVTQSDTCEMRLASPGFLFINTKKMLILLCCCRQNFILNA